MGSTDSKKRQDLLRQLLAQGEMSTQEELADELRRHDFDITQSTISRDLRRIGAVKAIDASGATVYRLSLAPAGASAKGTLPVSGLKDLLVDIQHNGSMIVIHTRVGSASLMAAHFDQVNIKGILGTIAGDDTIFIAPASPQHIEPIIEAIQKSF